MYEELANKIPWNQRIRWKPNQSIKTTIICSTSHIFPRRAWNRWNIVWPGCLWFYTCRYWIEHAENRRLTMPWTLHVCCCRCGLGLFFPPTFFHLLHCLQLPFFPLLGIFLLSSCCSFLLSWPRHLDAVILFCYLQHLPHHFFTFFFNLNPEHLLFSTPCISLHLCCFTLNHISCSSGSMQNLLEFTLKLHGTSYLWFWNVHWCPEPHDVLKRCLQVIHLRL